MELIIRFFTCGLATAFYLLLAMSLVLLVWVPAVLLLILIASKVFLHRPLDLKGMSFPKMMASIWGVPYFIACGLLYWRNANRDGDVFYSILEGGVQGVISAFGGFIVAAIFFALVGLLLDRLEKWLSKFVELKASFGEAFKHSWVSACIGIFTCCYIFGDAIGMK